MHRVQNSYDLLPGSRYTERVKVISYNAMLMARDKSDAAEEFEFHGKTVGEMSPLKKGERVYFLTIDGELAGTVRRDWRLQSWPSPKVYVSLDCKPDHPIEFHRSLFRAFTVLDHIANT